MTSDEQSDPALKRLLKSHLLLLVENLKCDRIADYLWRDDLLTDDEYDVMRDVTMPGDERAREFVRILQRQPTSVALKPLIKALKCTGQFFIADKLSLGGQDAVDDAESDIESLAGYVHDISSTIRHASGVKYSLFKLQTGPSTFRSCVTDCPDLHRPILTEYLGLRTPLLLCNFEVADASDPKDPGKVRCGDETWFRTAASRSCSSGAAVVDFPWSAPELELTKLSALPQLPVGININIRANVVDERATKLNQGNATHSNGAARWSEQYVQVKLLADETAETTLSTRDGWVEKIIPGKAYEFVGLIVKFYSNQKYLTMTDLTAVKEIAALKNSVSPFVEQSTPKNKTDDRSGNWRTARAGTGHEGRGGRGGKMELSMSLNSNSSMLQSWRRELENSRDGNPARSTKRNRGTNSRSHQGDRHGSQGQSSAPAQYGEDTFSIDASQDDDAISNFLMSPS